MKEGFRCGAAGAKALRQEEVQCLQSSKKCRCGQSAGGKGVWLPAGLARQHWPTGQALPSSENNGRPQEVWREPGRAHDPEGPPWAVWVSSGGDGFMWADWGLLSRRQWVIVVAELEKVDRLKICLVGKVDGTRGWLGPGGKGEGTAFLSTQLGMWR